MLGRILVSTGRVLCRRRNNRLIRMINRAIQILYFKIENDNNDVRTNGEARVIDIVSRFGFSTFLDVGANHGEWTQQVIRLVPNRVVHAFEASPITFEFLKTKFDNEPGIVLNNVGLFSEEGTMNFYQGIDDTQSSLVSSEKHRDSRIIEVNVSTLDNYCSVAGIQGIDLLKIDTEGADFEILKGAKHLLDKGNIKVIQFEYGFVSINTRKLLADFYELLGDKYILGKIYPGAVEFAAYERSMENFIGPNYLAVRKDLVSIIDKLK